MELFAIRCGEKWFRYMNNYDQTVNWEKDFKKAKLWKNIRAASAMNNRCIRYNIQGTQIVQLKITEVLVIPSKETKESLELKQKKAELAAQASVLKRKLSHYVQDLEIWELLQGKLDKINSQIKEINQHKA